MQWFQNLGFGSDEEFEIFIVLRSQILRDGTLRG